MLPKLSSDYAGFQIGCPLVRHIHKSLPPLANLTSGAHQLQHVEAHECRMRKEMCPHLLIAIVLLLQGLKDLELKPAQPDIGQCCARCHQVAKASKQFGSQQGSRLIVGVHFLW